MNLAELNKVARAMVAPGKGILAADESSGTIKKRFDAIGVESTEDNRRDYREMLFRSAEAHEAHLRRHPLRRDHLAEGQGRHAAGQAHQEGRRASPASRSTKAPSRCRSARAKLITVGLDKLADRLPKYYEQGARFAKWRAVIDIGAGIPSYNCIKANAHALARYAALCQEAQIVPIVEPEVLMDGDHDIDRCFAVTERVLKAMFERTVRRRTSRSKAWCSSRTWSIAGKKMREAGLGRGSRREDRDACSSSACRRAVPGIAFLSGGQTDEEATAHLDAMNKIGDLPWTLTFSYGRALQHAPQKAWTGKAENVAAAQRAFAHRAEMNGLAALGQWKADLEKKAA